jgi:hypothetical protein
MWELMAGLKLLWRRALWPALRWISIKWFRLAVERGPHGIAGRYLYGKA